MASPPPASQRPASRPLAGLLVVDLSRYLPGPLVGRLLGDLGARVIKVEEPELGDPSRHIPEGEDGPSSLATMLLAGHESLALDLKKPAARDSLEDLLLRADVLVESFRPGVMARLGFDPADLRQRYPRLVICSVTGFGQDGPHARRAGHDLTYLALAGALASNPTMPTVQVADIVGGWSAASAVLAALYRRQLTGEGAWIDQSLHDAAVHAAITAWSAEADGEKAVGEPLLLTGAIPCYDLYRTADGGYLAMAALEPKFWRSFCAGVGRRDLVLQQYSRDPAVRREVAAIVAGKTRQEWATWMAEHDVPAEPVLAPAEALEHPQTRHRDLLRRGGDDRFRLAFPACLDGERPRSGEACPEIGEHTEALIDELGLASELSARQRRAGGIGRRRSVKRWLLGRVARWVAKG